MTLIQQIERGKMAQDLWRSILKDVEPPAMGQLVRWLNTFGEEAFCWALTRTANKLAKTPGMDQIAACKYVTSVARHYRDEQCGIHTREEVTA